MPSRGRTESNAGVKVVPTWGQIRFKTGNPYIQWKTDLPPYLYWNSGNASTW